jgi:hypothetical protein
VAEPRDIDALLNGLRDAAAEGDAGDVAGRWRSLGSDEQEGVVLALLGLDPATVSPESPAEATAPIEPATVALEATAGIQPVGDTELIPKVVEDLRGLTATSDRFDEGAEEVPAADPDNYWSRWRRRWKISAVVAAWAVTTVFAFTAETSTYGPMEWVVSLIGTVVLGGAAVGTLLNFAAALPELRSAP